MHEKDIQNLLVGIYQEIYLNDLAVMRGAAPLFTGIDSPNGIIYLSDFPSLVDTSSPRRALDIATLVYSILNGLRRMLGNKLFKNSNYQYCKCIYNLKNLAAWNKECNALKLLKLAAEILGISTKKLNKKNPLREFIAIITEIIEYLINNGYIIPIPYKAVNLSPYPLKFMKIESIRSNYYEIKPSSVEELASIKTAIVLNGFFKTVCRSFNQKCDPYELLNEIEKIIEYKIYGNTLYSHNEISKNEHEIMFKTYHGELIRTIYNSKPLPTNIINFEGRVLPFIFEIPPLSVNQHDIYKLRDLINKCFTHSGIPDDKSQILTEILLQAFIDAGYRFLNNYQYNYLKKIFQNYLNNKSPIRALLASPTGTGKTLIFVMYALFLSLLGKAKNESIEYKTIITYPRKALATDQLLKIIKIVYLLNEKLNLYKDKLLKKINISIGIRDGDSPSYSDLKSKEFIPLRNLEISTKDGNIKIYHKIDEDNYKYCVKIGEKATCEENEIIIRDYKKPEIFNSDIIITNHSQLNKLLSKVILGNNTKSVSNFINKLKLLIIDEAHIFLERKNTYILQSALLKLYYYKGSNKKSTKILHGLNKLDIILSSATITNSSLTDINIGEQQASIPSRNIIGIFRLSKDINQNIDEIRSLFNKIILEPSDKNSHNLIYIDYYSTLSETKNVIENYNGIYKIRSSAVIVPYPHRSSWTSLNESLIALTHWINSQRKKGRVTAAMVFVDSKATLKEIFRIYNERQIVHAKDHIDRVLLSVLDRNIKERRKAYETIVKVILSNSNNDFYSIIWDLTNKSSEYFSLFHCLSHYLDLNSIKQIRKLKIPNKERLLIYKFNESSLLREIYNDMEKITSYSSFILENNVFENLEKTPTSKIESRIDQTLNMLNDYVQKNGIPPFYILHHGSLSKKARSFFENTLKKARNTQYMIPYIIFSTSTLEVGVDIPYISVVIQYGSDPLSQEIQQRFGRSGRSQYSMFISLGLLILRNRGEDLAYITDEAATEYVYSLRIPYISSIIDDPIEILRQTTGVLFELNINSVLTSQRKLERDIMRIEYFIENLLKDIIESYNLKNLNTEFLINLTKNWNNRIRLFMTKPDRNKFINMIEVHIQDLNSFVLALEDELKKLRIERDPYISRYAQKLLQISKIIKTCVENLQKYPKRIDIILGTFSYLAHIVNYNLFEISYSIYSLSLHSTDENINLLLNSYYKLLEKVVNILNNISLHLQTLLKDSRLHTDIDIAKVLMLIYPPGYANPVTYTENIYKLIEFEDVDRPPCIYKDAEFFTLITRSRPLHTG